MSHFVTIVLLEDQGEQDRKTIHHRVDELIEPYYEGKLVPEYERDCYCIGIVAKREARKIAEEKCGTLDELSKSFHQDEEVKRLDQVASKRWKHRDLTDEEIEEVTKAEDQIQSLWEKHISEYIRVEAEALAKHPNKDSPDPECGFYIGTFWEKQVEVGELDASQLGQRFEDGSGCGGTGKYMSQYNPLSKWDWWIIGGRWTGWLSDYDPMKDPDNQEECRLCHGTGDRPDWVYYEDAAGNHIEAWTGTVEQGPSELAQLICGDLDQESPKIFDTTELSVHVSQRMPDKVDDLKRRFRDNWSEQCNGCNGCQGKGTRVAWLFKQFDGDILPAARWLGLLDQNPKKYSPFAIVTPDGEWHERGDMGWWATVSNKKDEDQWRSELNQFAEKYVNCIAVVCDMHI